MSFILDALKKLEQKRQQGNVPDLTTVHLSSVQHSKKRPVLLYLFFAALLVNAAVLAVLFLPVKQERQEIIVDVAPEQMETPALKQEEKYTDSGMQVPAVTPEAEKTDVKGSRADIKELPAPENTASGKTATLPDKPEQENIPAESDKKPVVTEDTLPEETETSLSLQPSAEEIAVLKNKIKDELSFAEDISLTETFPEEEEAPELEKRVLEFGQLPADVKKELPRILIKGHIYSNRPSARLVNVNGIISREGDKVTGALKVEEITMSGVIFDYQGIRFRVRAF